MANEEKENQGGGGGKQNQASKYPPLHYLTYFDKAQKAKVQYYIVRELNIMEADLVALEHLYKLLLTFFFQTKNNLELYKHLYQRLLSMHLKNQVPRVDPEEQNNLIDISPDIESDSSQWAILQKNLLIEFYKLIEEEVVFLMSLSSVMTIFLNAVKRLEEISLRLVLLNKGK